MGKLDNILEQAAIGREFLDPVELMRPGSREGVLASIDALSCSEEIKGQLKEQITVVVNIKEIAKRISRRKRGAFNKALKVAKTREDIEIAIDNAVEDEEEANELKGFVSNRVQLSGQARKILFCWTVILKSK